LTEENRKSKKKAPKTSLKPPAAENPPQFEEDGRDPDAEKPCV
jgi:hypothetical protein